MKKNWKNRLVALALTATTALSCAAIGTASGITSSAATSTLCGDVNLDGVVSTSDTINLNYYIAGKLSLSSQAKKNADVNRDGYVDADDAIVLLKYNVGTYPYLPFDDSYQTGDVNLDGKINVYDLIQLKAYVNAGVGDGNYLPTAVKCACDVNWDCKIDSTDVTILTKYQTKKISSLPYKGTL